MDIENYIIGLLIAVALMVCINWSEYKTPTIQLTVTALVVGLAWPFTWPYLSVYVVYKLLVTHIKKKFKVRVMHHSRGSYCIQYSYHRVIPTWYDITHWRSYDFGTGLEKHRVALFSDPYEAEIVAQKFKCIEDVENHIKDELDREEQFYKEQAEWKKQVIPFTSKIIKE